MRESVTDGAAHPLDPSDAPASTPSAATGAASTVGLGDGSVQEPEQAESPGEQPGSDSWMAFDDGWRRRRHEEDRDPDPSIAEVAARRRRRRIDQGRYVALCAISGCIPVLGFLYLSRAFGLGQISDGLSTRVGWSVTIVPALLALVAVLSVAVSTSASWRPSAAASPAAADRHARLDEINAQLWLGDMRRISFIAAAGAFGLSICTAPAWATMSTLLAVSVLTAWLSAAVTSLSRDSVPADLAFHRRQQAYSRALEKSTAMERGVEHRDLGPGGVLLFIALLVILWGALHYMTVALALRMNGPPPGLDLASAHAIAFANSVQLVVEGIVWTALIFWAALPQVTALGRVSRVLAGGIAVCWFVLRVLGGLASGYRVESLVLFAAMAGTVSLVVLGRRGLGPAQSIFAFVSLRRFLATKDAALLLAKAAEHLRE